MKTRHFTEFFNKTSKIIERALGNATDVTGGFFENAGDDENKAKQNKRDRV